MKSHRKKESMRPCERSTRGKEVPKQRTGLERRAKELDTRQAPMTPKGHDLNHCHLELAMRRKGMLVTTSSRV